MTSEARPDQAWWSTASGNTTSMLAAAILLRPALSRVATSAWGSLSTASAKAAPRRRAATARMPEPQP